MGCNLGTKESIFVIKSFRKGIKSMLKTKEELAFEEAQRKNKLGKLYNNLTALDTVNSGHFFCGYYNFYELMEVSQEIVNLLNKEGIYDLSIFINSERTKIEEILSQTDSIEVKEISKDSNKILDKITGWFLKHMNGGHLFVN